MIAAIIPPADALLADIRDAAIAHGMYIITDGCRVVVSPIVPPGWHRMGISVKSVPIPREVPQCATP